MKKVININSGWDFTKENCTEKVNLPHTWNAVDGQSDKNYYRGKCSYKKTIQRYDGGVVLEINGANTRSEVFVNGAPILFCIRRSRISPFTAGFTVT